MCNKKKWDVPISKEDLEDLLCFLESKLLEKATIGSYIDLADSFEYTEEFLRSRGHDEKTFFSWFNDNFEEDEEWIGDTCVLISLGSEYGRAVGHAEEY